MYSAFRFSSPDKHSRAVPSNWVQGTDECYWPNVSKIKKIERLTEQCVQPFTSEDNWSLFSGRLLQSNLELESAKNRAVNDKNRNYRDTTTDVEGSPVKKRQRRIIKPKSLDIFDTTYSPSKDSCLSAYVPSPGKEKSHTKNKKPATLASPVIKRSPEKFISPIANIVEKAKSASSIKRNISFEEINDNDTNNISSGERNSPPVSPFKNPLGKEGSSSIMSPCKSPLSNGKTKIAHSPVLTTRRAFQPQQCYVTKSPTPSTSFENDGPSKSDRNGNYPKIKKQMCNCNCCDHKFIVPPKILEQQMLLNVRDVKSWSDSDFRIYVVGTLKWLAAQSNIQKHPKSSDLDMTVTDVEHNCGGIISTLEDIKSLEKELEREEFRKKWIAGVYAKTSNYVCAETGLRELGRVIIRSIFNPSAQQAMCFSGLAAGKFPLEKAGQKSYLLQSLESIFKKHGVKKFPKIKKAIQTVIYKSKRKTSMASKSTTSKSPQKKSPRKSPQKSLRYSPQKSPSKKKKPIISDSDSSLD